MDAQQQIFGLMAVAEEHQKAVKAAIDGLTAERAALARERAALSQVANDARKAAADAVPAIQKATSAAVSASVKESLAGASTEAAKALGEAAKPVISSLSGVVRAAGEAEGSLRSAGQWFAWKWVAVAAGGLIGVCLVAYASLWWQLHEVESLSARKAALTADVAQLQTTVAGLDKAGGRVVWSTCGGRLCFEVSSNQGTYSNGTKIPLGGWTVDNGRVPTIIPRGY